jgi:hypothetical protein
MIENVQNAWQRKLEEIRLAGISEGEQKGLQQGVELGKKELVLQLLGSGIVDIPTISKLTGITENEIRSWMQ